MGARQESDLAGEGAQFVEAASVHAFAVFQHEAAGGRLLRLVKQLADGRAGGGLFSELLRQFFGQFLLERRAGVLAIRFADDLDGLFEAVSQDLRGGGVKAFGGRRGREFPFGFAGFLDQLLLGRDDGKTGFLAGPQGGVEVLFADFIGRAFEHHHVGFVADVDEVQVAGLHFRVGGVGDELSVHPSDARGAERAGPGNVAHAEGR